jgi:type II secretory pathway pseudopilin PulG
MGSGLVAQTRRAFTFVELLIVVAALALMGAIFLGSFTRASLQSDVALAQSRMATLADALEAYKVDNGVYPACDRSGLVVRRTAGELEVLERLSTPIAYVADSLLPDPFPASFRRVSSTAAAQAAEAPTAVAGNEWLGSFIYQSWLDTNRSQTTVDSFVPTRLLPATAYALQSAGPSATMHNLGGILANDFLPDGPVLLMYDPTNGAVSAGGIFCVGGTATASQFYAAGAGLLAVAPSCIAQTPSSVGESWTYY